MAILAYIQTNWALLLLMTGMFLLVRTNVHLNKGIYNSMRILLALLLALSVCDSMEIAERAYTEYSRWHVILCTFKYATSPLILVSLLTLFSDRYPRRLFIPAAVNLVLCFATMFTGLVVRVDEHNVFSLGPLVFVPFLVSAFYVVVLFYDLLHKQKNIMREDLAVVIFMICAVIATAIMLFVWPSHADNWFYTTIAIDAFMYYVYWLHQMTKRDPLTGLLNRQSYYSDVKRYQNNITVLITSDLNGLKKINDSGGHHAGDTAISTLAICFENALLPSQRAYRIGGDEFVILGFSNTHRQMEELMQRIRDNMACTPYSCSLGYSYTAEGRPIDELYKEADQKMYADKQAFYQANGHDRRKGPGE